MTVKGYSRNMDSDHQELLSLLGLAVVDGRKASPVNELLDAATIVSHVLVYCQRAALDEHGVAALTESAMIILLTLHRRVAADVQPGTLLFDALIHVCRTDGPPDRA
jgi:hypothetical protein